ncbi:glutaminase A [Actinomadura rupiterrae]|uniref:glutaminase A n=1 Tax=Actinomadura rupiterrae TaxID=559627 RepID=UPI0020A5368B|nr:glutaminase A [Actinomadura rupiterrae]MCP2337144.1 glutaminase [Actinomadura rupiterrae]
MADAEDIASPVQQLLDEVHQRIGEIDDGRVATYIPALGKADPKLFGLALATRDGHVYEAGDTRVPFTIQSVSKPFIYALALHDRGLNAVLRKVGVEPTGEGFDAIKLEAGTGRPLNPMVNAGAIVTASMVDGDDWGQRFQRILDGLSGFAGRDLSIDHEVLASEERTGDHNRAIGYLLRNAGTLDGDVDKALSVYFMACSTLVTARDLAVMAMTLSSGGVNPLTGRRVVGTDTTEHVMAVMATSGTYDFAGEWLLRSGLPAKSGVAGGLVAVLPSQLGIGVYSPPLDTRGTSVRAIAACQELSSRFGLHLMRPVTGSTSAIHRYLRGDAVSSQRSRRYAEREILRTRGRAIALCELQGDLGFASTDVAVRAITGDHDGVRWLILDLHRVARTEPVAVNLLDTLVRELGEHGVTTVVAAEGARSPLASAEAAFASLDEALEWCEDALVAGTAPAEDTGAAEAVPVPEQDVLRDLPPGVLDELTPLLEERRLAAGEILFAPRGEPDESLYFVVSGGLVAQVMEGDPPEPVQVASMGPGTAVTELTLRRDDPRAYRVVADEPTVCRVLSDGTLKRLERDRPQVVEALHWAMARSLAARLRRADRLLAAHVASGPRSGTPPRTG